MCAQQGKKEHYALNLRGNFCSISRFESTTIDIDWFDLNGFFLKLRWNGNNDPICGWCWRFTSWKSEDNLRVEFKPKPCAAWNVFFPKVSPRPKHIQYEAGSFKVAQIKFLKPRWWRMVSWRNESEAVAASRSNQVHSCYDALLAPTHPQGPRRNRSGAVLGVPSGTKALQWPCWTPCPCLKFMLLSFFVS